jgi:hypothetical protein
VRVSPGKIAGSWASCRERTFDDPSDGVRWHCPGPEATHYAAQSGRVAAVELPVCRRHTLVHVVDHRRDLPPGSGVGGAGFHQRHADVPGPQLNAKGVGESLEGELRGAVDALHGNHHPAAGRGDEHDPAPGGSEPRENGLGDRDLADDVDVELVPQVRRRDGLDRAQHADGGVVDQRVQPLRQPVSQGGDACLVGDVELDRRDAPIGCGEAFLAGVVADAGEDCPAGAS